MSVRKHHLQYPALVGCLCSLLLFFGCLPTIPGLPGFGSPPASGEKSQESADGEDAVEPAAPIPPPVSPIPGMRHVPFTAVKFKMPDGLWLQGRLYDPSQQSLPEPNSHGDIEAISAVEGADTLTNKGPTFPLLILLHSVDGSLHDWLTIPKSFVEKGYAVLALDLRGHGNSTKTKKNTTGWRLFQEADWQLLPKDIQSVILAMQAIPAPFPQVDAKKIVIMGTGLGSNVAITALGLDPNVPVNPLAPPDRKLPEALRHVRGLALWSPRMTLKGLNPTVPMLNVSCPVALIGDPQDPLSSKAMAQLSHLAKTPVTTIEKPSGNTMTGSLLTDWSDGLKQLLPWLHNVCPAKRINGK